MMKLISTIVAAAITLHSFATENKKQLTLRLVAETAADDKAYLNFDQGFNTAFVTNEDAEKIQGTSAGIPVIYMLSSDNIACSTNNYGEFTQDETIAIGINVDADGTYIFSLEGLVNFAPSSIIQLEDKANATLTVLNNAPYSANITATENETGRFYLHVLQPAVYDFVNADCSNTSGKINISYSPTILWSSVNLIDSNGVLIQTLDNATGTFNFADLAGGNYQIQYNYGSQFTATEQVTLESGAVTASIDNTVTIVAVSQEIQFLASVSNATEYTWTISDGSLITGVVNTYYTFHQKGDYSVIFNARNDLGCTASDTAYFSVQEPTGITNVGKEQINIWAANNRITVNIPQAQISNGVIRIYNLLGTQIYSQFITSSVSEITLSDVPNSYYIVSVENNKMKRTQKVFIGN